MFKLIFRTIVIIVFVIVLSTGTAVWKGGAPFRWIGEKTVSAGNVMLRLGDYIDDIKSGTQKVKKTYEEIKDTISPKLEEKKQKK